MQKLTELENSISRLSESEYSKFRDWFWEYENERWDAKIEKDAANGNLTPLAEQALKDFKEGKYKSL